MDKQLNLTYSLDNNPIFLLEQDNKVENFFKCTHNFEPFKQNYKNRCDKSYKFHTLRQRATCINCELSLCRKCVSDLFNFAFEERDSFIKKKSNIDASTKEEEITHLLNQIKTTEDQVERLTLENNQLKHKRNL